jgi:hypothetical protein
MRRALTSGQLQAIMNRLNGARVSADVEEECKKRYPTCGFFFKKKNLLQDQELATRIKIDKEQTRK